MSANAPDLGRRLPTLEGERVELRWIEAGDLPALEAIFSDPEVTRFLGTPRIRGRRDAERFLGEIRAGFRERTLLEWGVAERTGGSLIGTCTLAGVSWLHRRAEVGFALNRRHQGQGIMSEALPLLVGFAFRELGLHRLEADADPRNVPSLRLLERSGFRREGYLRERYHQEGELQDAVFFGLLRREYEAFTRGSAHRRR